MSERFQTRAEGPSWCVVDTEILTTIGPRPGSPRTVQWFSTEEEARAKADELNRTRGHASDEPRCIECGAQPAAGNPPRCATHNSRLFG